jgi:hypothetical protein
LSRGSCLDALCPVYGRGSSLLRDVGAHIRTLLLVVDDDLCFKRALSLVTAEVGQAGRLLGREVARDADDVEPVWQFVERDERH